jgi:hypothetical protein
MPPSITFWNRLEPRPRANSVAESLAAPVRDPLWLLSRQWQVGEFAASDCGSPVYVDLQAHAGALSGWAPGNGAAAQQWTGPAPPLETAVESEPFTPDLATRVELGQWFEALLGANPGPLTINLLRSTYTLPPVLDPSVDRLFAYTGTLGDLDQGTAPADLLAAFQTASVPISAAAVWAVTAGAQWVITDTPTGLTFAVVKDPGGAGASVYRCRDANALRFLRVCAGRACDGVAILAAAQSGAAILPPQPSWSAQQTQALADAGKALADAVRAVYGSIGRGDPPAWMPERLSFELKVAATSATAAVDTLKATPGPNGEFGWTSFDLSSDPMTGIAAGAVATLNQAIMPGHVRFRGMPNARWWEFETAQTDFGGVQPEKRDLAKLIFMDFMLIHGDDWYLAPLEAPLGTITRIDGLYVHDVFGVVTQIDRAEATTAAGLSPGRQWTMFSPAWIGQPPKVGTYMVIPPSAWPTAMTGPVIEEARFLRDPVADLVWGVETVVESGTGHPWPGRERDRGGKPARTETRTMTPDLPPLRYLLHTPVPANWFPFVPAPRSNGNGYALQRAVLPGDAAGAVTPAGRILQASVLREQEVSTQGTVVSRVVCRSRWIDGSTRLWISRRRGFGLGQGSSGLRFDVAACG